MDLAFNTGGACNGGGLPITFNTSTVFCECFNDYSGSADFFDASAVPSPDGRVLALGCSNFRPAEIAVWALGLLVTIYRMFQVTRLFVEKYGKLKEKQNKPSGFLFDNFALKVLAFDMLTVFPMLSAVCALKISGRTIGTDIATTLLFIGSVITFQVGNEILAGEEFRVITSYLAVDKHQRLRSLRFRLQMCTLMAYALGMLLPYLISLSLDKSLGPIANGEYITLLVRNLATYPWALGGLLANRMVFTRLEAVMGSLMDSKSRGALAQMRSANLGITRLYLSVVIIFTLFSLPWLWGFQTYSYALVVVAGAVRSPANAFKGDATLLNPATGSSNGPNRTIANNNGDNNTDTKNAVTSDNDDSKNMGSLAAFSSTGGTA